MTLLSLLKAAFGGLQRAASQQLAYQQLRDLDPRLLADIGLRVEAGRVVAATGAPEPKRRREQADAVDAAARAVDYQLESGGAGG